jgi:hypothetical protein
MQNTTLKGVMSLCAGAFVFTLQDVLLKYVSGSYPLSEVIVLRTVIAVPILLALVGAMLIVMAGLIALLAQGSRPIARLPEAVTKKI